MRTSLRFKSLLAATFVLTGFGLVPSHAQQPNADAGERKAPEPAISFDATGKMTKTVESQTYWRGHPGQTYTASFTEAGGDKATLQVQFVGTLYWTPSRVTMSPDFNVKSLSAGVTEKNPKTPAPDPVWVPVKSFKAVGTGLVVEKEDGTAVRLHDFDKQFTGKFEPYVAPKKDK